MVEKLQKNIIVAAVLSSEVPDTTNEIINIRNADISTLNSGSAPVNTEHVNPEDLKESLKDKDGKDFAGFDTVVGRVVSAKKIFGPEDCENEYESEAWNSLGVPLIHGIVEFFDGPNATDNQKAAASLVRMAHKNNFDHMVGFSVEGQILKRQGNRLEECVIKKLAATLKPANKSATIQGVIKDTSSSSDTVRKAEVDENFFYKTVSSKFNIVEDDFGLSSALFKLKKALEAGIPSAAPGALIQGASLQPENHESDLAKLLKLTGKKPISKIGLKKFIPQATDEQLDKIHNYLKAFRLKKHEALCKEAFEELSK